MNRAALVEVALKDPRIRDRQQVVDWLASREVIELPGGAMILNGNRVHLEMEPEANKVGFIRSLSGALDAAFRTRTHLTADLPQSNSKMIALAKWHGFRIERGGEIVSLRLTKEQWRHEFRR